MIPSRIHIAAVGDLSFEGRINQKPSREVFSAVEPILKGADLAIGNLEGPLIVGGDPVCEKCTLRGVTIWAQIIRDAGIQLVSLANNHIMDYGVDGLQSTIRALNEAGLLYVGAGRNKDEASAPRFMDIADRRLAFLARTSVVVSSPSYAEEAEAGVAFLDVEETKANIRASKKRADFVVLMIHWGLEEYHYPSPSQRFQAAEFIEAGADLILGHHPHVLQGLEYIGKRLACYSLGNFVFDDVKWFSSNQEPERLNSRVERLTPDNRKGGILRVNFSEVDIESYAFSPTYIHPDGTVQLDTRPERKKEMGHLMSRLHWPKYSLFWHGYSIRQECCLRLAPLLRGTLSLKKIKRIRVNHFRKLINTIQRSAKITSEKSTNPYE